MRGKKSSVEHLWAATQYEEIRKALLEDGDTEYLDKPLAHWVLPADRRLPLVFLGRSLGELLEAGFDELAATPGVGQKKIRSFLNLLSRVAEAVLADANGDGRVPILEDRSTEPTSSSKFDPDHVSEAVWNEWQESVRRCELGHEPLGRVAPTLKNVTRAIWSTPLKEYLGVPLADLRERKSYGEKRVRAVLEVFFGLHRLVGDLSTHDQLVVRLTPRRIDEVERWTGQCLQCPKLPDSEQLCECFVCPLIEQLKLDASQQIVELAEIRLGVGGPITSVRQAARRMELTRARVYQLLNEINDILTVRWPLGRCHTYQLLDRLEGEAPGDMSLRQFRAAVELFYPGARRGAAGFVEGPLRN
jgi:hypothetical protein